MGNSSLWRTLKILGLILAFCVFYDARAEAPLDGYQKRAADAAQVDTSKMKAVLENDVMKRVNETLKENLDPQTAAVVSNAVSQALKEEGADEPDDSLKNRAKKETEKRVPEKKRKCAALKVCKGTKICGCDGDEKKDDPEDELKDTNSNKANQTEKTATPSEKGAGGTSASGKGDGSGDAESADEGAGEESDAEDEEASSDEDDAALAVAEDELETETETETEEEGQQ